MPVTRTLLYLVVISAAPSILCARSCVPTDYHLCVLSIACSSLALVRSLPLPASLAASCWGVPISGFLAQVKNAFHDQILEGVRERR